MGRLARKVIATLRSGGLRGLIWQALAVAGVRRLTVYCRPLDDHFAPAATPGVSVRPLSGADADAYRALRPGAPEAELELRLEAGDRCLAAWRDGCLVGVYWLALREAPIPYLDLSVRLVGNAWFAYDVFVAAQERGRGIHNVLRLEAVSRGRSEGAVALLSAVLPENRGGRQITRRSRRLGTLISVRIGPWRLAHSTVRPGDLGRPRFSERSGVSRRPAADAT